MNEKEKPIVIKGENKTALSIFIGEREVTLTVLRKTESEFERIDRYIIPVSYLLLKIFEKNRGMFSDLCEIVEKIEE